MTSPTLTPAWIAICASRLAELPSFDTYEEALTSAEGCCLESAEDYVIFSPIKRVRRTVVCEDIEPEQRKPRQQRKKRTPRTPPSRISGEADAAQSPPDVAASAESLTEASNQNGGEADRTGVSTGPDNTTPQPEANLTAGADPLDIPPRLDRRQNGAQT